MVREIRAARDLNADISNPMSQVLADAHSHVTLSYAHVRVHALAHARCIHES